MKDPYSILGISSSATDDEVKEAYRTLARKYHPDNYGDDNPLKDLANEKMQEINAAYDEIQRIRQGGAENKRAHTGSYSTSGSGAYYQIRNLINSRRFGEAERLINDVPEMDRGAEWHYLQSVVLMHKGLVNDAMRELETACMMDPSNLEYQKAKQMFNNQARGYGNNYYYGSMNGRRAASSDACDCCANLICMDCLCECMGGDLIACC